MAPNPDVTARRSDFVVHASERAICLTDVSSPAEDQELTGPLFPFGNSVTIPTGVWGGPVGVAVEQLDEPPELLDGWEDVVECSLVLGDGTVFLHTCSENFAEIVTPWEDVVVCLRVHATGRDNAWDLIATDAVESYLIQVWPARRSAPSVVRATSAAALGMGPFRSVARDSGTGVAGSMSRASQPIDVPR